MKLHRLIRVQKLQDKNGMVGKTFNVLEANERRKLPWIGSAWFTKEERETGEPDEAQEAKRQAYFKQWEHETEQLLKINPKLKIIS